MYTDSSKRQMIEALSKDQFKVIDKRDFILAIKKENMLYIRGVDDIHIELDFKYIAQNMQLANVGGIEIKELRRLISEAPNKETRKIVEYVCTKLNWYPDKSELISVGSKDIECIQLVTDREETITLVFFASNKGISFIALEATQNQFLKIIDALQYKSLQTLAPQFYELTQTLI